MAAQQTEPAIDAYALLLRAVRQSLTPEEQDRVLHAVLNDRPGSSLFGLAASMPVHQHPVKAPGTEEVGFLVRLPAPLHREFRAWSKAHGFSMAVVIRGLVERFLARQGGRS